MSYEEKKIESDRVKSILKNLKKANQMTSKDQRNIDIVSLNNKNESRNNDEYSNQSILSEKQTKIYTM